MYELDECLKYTRRITDISYRIQELEVKNKSPKNQIITGMPRGSSTGSPLDDNIAKIDVLKGKRQDLIQKRSELWEAAVKRLNENGIKAEYIELMRHRFFFGLRWEKCAEAMDKKHPNQKWNENKCFRVYRTILKACSKHHN